jgi:hypothetical protein
MASENRGRTLVEAISPEGRLGAGLIARSATIADAQPANRIENPDYGVATMNEAIARSHERRSRLAHSGQDGLPGFSCWARSLNPVTVEPGAVVEARGDRDHAGRVGAGLRSANASESERKSNLAILATE